jgi:hypothetical protein
MTLNAVTNLPLVSLPALLLVAVAANAKENEPFNQADVYNALYEAYAQCDEDLDQSRSEFIADEIERNGANRLSMELLTTLLAYNVRSAKQSISDKTEERERYVAEMLRAPKMSVDESGEEADASRKRHEKIRQIDAFLKRERRYVAVRECVLETLDKAPE